MKVTYKYIITDYGAILFSEMATHSQVGLGFEKIYSAGFVTITYGNKRVDKIEAYGESVSLQIPSSPLHDSIIIGDLFRVVSRVKYEGLRVKDLYS